MQEATGLQVCGTEGQDINGRQPSLFASRYKHDHRLLRGMLDDSMVDRLGHRNQSGCIVGNVESLKHTKRHITA